MNSKIKATLRKFLSVVLAALTVFGCAGAAFAAGSAKMLPTSGFSAAHGSPSM